MLESKRKANDKYNNKCKHYHIQFNPEIDDDKKIIDKLDSEKSKNDYIRQLILKDIKEDWQPLFYLNRF